MRKWARYADKPEAKKSDGPEVKGESLLRPLSGGEILSLILVGLFTFVAFMTLDPDPNLLLATCSAFNIGIMLWAIFRLYAMRLLLSPIAAVLIGPAWFIQYSLGNLLARVAGEYRFGSNPGSLDYYPLAALLTSVSLLGFCWVCFGVFGRYIQYYRISYQDLTWQPWQALTTSLLAVAVLTYLSNKYEFVNGYFRQVSGQFDAALASSSYFFIVLALTVGVSVMLKARSGTGALMGFAGIVFPMLISLGLRSRTFMITEVITMVLCWLTLRPLHVRRTLVLSVVAAAILYILGSVIKQANVTGAGTLSISDNFRALTNLDLDIISEINASSSALDAEYHLAGYEFPATLLRSISHGASPIYGQAFIGGAFAGLPRFLRPAGVVESERLVIYRSFSGKGLRHGDSIGIPLTSGVADWGLFGPLIYVFLGSYCVIAWRLVQSSPRLFVAYLIVGVGVGDLVWDNIFFAIRALAFVWLVLIVLDRLIMPRWSPQTGVVAEQAAESYKLSRYSKYDYVRGEKRP